MARTQGQLTATTATYIAHTLRKAIQRGEYQTGTPLRQEELADQFKVSRLPVREALSILAAEGLLELHPNRGAFIPNPTPDDVQEIFDLRLLLETDALARALPYFTARTIRHLEAVQRELDDEDDPHRWLELDQTFHDTLYAPGQRPRTRTMITSLRAVLNRFYLKLFTPERHRGAWNHEHASILDAVQAGYVDDAVAALRSHLEAAACMTLQRVRLDYAQTSSSSEL